MLFLHLACTFGILMLLQLPFWALVSFGAYLLFKLGLGVFTFNDVPDAHKELMAQISEARTELRAKGVDVGED
jgi:dolichol-phosphate mannosyltransferase subunit 3